MKLPRRPTSNVIVNELQSQRNAMITPQEAANVQLAKYGAIAAGIGAVGDVFAEVAEVERKTIEAQDRIQDANDTETFNASIKRGQVLSEQNKWTPEELSEYNEEQIKAYEDTSGIQDDARRSLIDQVRKNRATIARDSAALDANVLRAKRATETLQGNYTNAVEAQNWNAAEMFLEVGLETGAFKASDVAEKRIAIEAAKRKETMDAKVEGIYQAYLADPDKGNDLYEDVARNESMDDEDRTYILNEAEKRMQDADRIHKGEKADESLQFSRKAEDVKRGMMTGDEPQSTADILAMDFGDNKHGDDLKNRLWDFAFKIESSKEALTTAPEGGWVDDQKHREMADQSVQATMEATRSRVEAEGGEWDAQTEELAYVSASAVQVRQHGVVPESAVIKFKSVHDVESFADTAFLAAVLMGEGARVDIHAGTQMAKHFDNVAAIIQSGERGQADPESIARSYWNNRIEITQEEVDDIQKRWNGKVNQQGHRYDSVEARIANTFDDDYIRDALGGMPGWIDYFRNTESDTELVPKSQIEALRARMVGAAGRAYAESLTEAQAETAGRLLLTNNARMSYGLNVDEGGDPIHQVMLHLPPMVTQEPGTSRDPEAVSYVTDHTPLRAQLRDVELPNAISELGEGTKLTYVKAGQNYIVDAADLGKNELYFEPISLRGKDTEYEVFVRDTETGTLSAVNITNTANGKVRQLYLNTDVNEAQQRAQLEADLGVAIDKRDKFEKSLEAVQPEGATSTITLPPEAGAMSTQRIGFGAATGTENFRRKAQKEVDIIEEKLRVHF